MWTKWSKKFRARMSERILVSVLRKKALSVITGDFFISESREKLTKVYFIKEAQL